MLSTLKQDVQDAISFTNKLKGPSETVIVCAQLAFPRYVCKV